MRENMTEEERRAADEQLAHLGAPDARRYRKEQAQIIRAALAKAGLLIGTVTDDQIDAALADAGVLDTSGRIDPKLSKPSK